MAGNVAPMAAQAWFSLDQVDVAPGSTVVLQLTVVNLADTTDAPYANHLGLAKAWRDDDFYQQLQRLLADPQFGYEAWLRELQTNERGFRPFDDPALAAKDLNRVVAGQPVETGFFNKGLGRDYLRGKLNDALPKPVLPADGPAAFVTAFSEVLGQALTDKVPGFS